jgi:hypothetical protein
MKATFKLMIAAICLLAACQSKTTKVQSFIEGIYVNHAQKYGTADDTLTFVHTDGGHYTITRNTGYQAIRNGKLLPKKHKLEKVEGDYDSQTNLLNETTAGRIFHFNPAKQILLLNQAVYRKLN